MRWPRAHACRGTAGLQAIGLAVVLVAVSRHLLLLRLGVGDDGLVRLRADLVHHWHANYHASSSEYRSFHRSSDPDLDPDPDLSGDAAPWSTAATEAELTICSWGVIDEPSAGLPRTSLNSLNAGHSVPHEQSQSVRDAVAHIARLTAGTKAVDDAAIVGLLGELPNVPVRRVWAFHQVVARPLYAGCKSNVLKNNHGLYPPSTSPSHLGNGRRWSATTTPRSL